MLRKIFFFYLFFYLSSSAQHTNAVQIFFSRIKRANVLSQRGYSKEAISLYQDLLRKDSSDILKLKIANEYQKLKMDSASMHWYNLIQDKESIFSEKDKFEFAEILLRFRKYKESVFWYKRVTSSDLLEFSNQRIKSIEEISSFGEDSLNYKIYPTGHLDVGGISCNGSNVLVSLSKTHEESLIRINDPSGRPFMLLFKAFIDSLGALNGFREIKLSEPNKFHIGQSVFLNSEMIVTMTLNNSRSKNKSVGLFVLENKQNSWSIKSAFPYNNEEYSIGQPTIGADSLTVFFVSDMPGGFGGLDIYSTTWKENKWSLPINLGPQINTKANDVYPYIVNDSSFYFSSTGHPGIGGLDVFWALKKNGNWQVKNVGIPINSSQHDYGLILNNKKNGGYFLSERNNSESNNELFQFHIVNVNLELNVVDHLRKNKLKQFEYSIYHKDKLILRDSCTHDADFALQLDPGKKYKIVIKKNGFITKLQWLTMPIDKLFTHVEIMLEREIRSYVKGVVKIGESTIPNIPVIHLTLDGFRDTIWTNSDGAFSLEIIPNQNSVLFVETDSLFGRVNLFGNTEKKGSYLYYVNINLNKYYVSEIIGRVMVSDTSIFPNTKIVVMREPWSSTEEISVDSSGLFYMKIKSFEKLIAQAKVQNIVLKQYEINGVNPPIELVFKIE